MKAAQTAKLGENVREADKPTPQCQEPALCKRLPLK